ncbi:hypothetical protein N2152v2_006937 [Parachlorella kessleri]
MAKPTVQYFEFRGRAEPIKLALAAKGVEFEVQSVDYQAMKADLEKFPFAQVPRYQDDEVNMGQSNAIMRHIGRKYDLYGKTRAEAAQIDQIIDGVEDVRRKYLALIYQDQLAPEAKKAYWEQHCDPASAGGRNGGAHWFYLAQLLRRNAGGEGYFVGTQLSVADVLVFDLVDLHLRVLEEQMRQTYPELVELWERVGALPAVKAYLESPLRLPRINNINLG